MVATFEDLKNKADVLKSKLTSSATAYTPNTAPSRSDVSMDAQLFSVNKQIEDLRSQQLRKKWYGPDDVKAEDTGGSDGLFMSTIKALQRPLNAIVGTAQYALGKGSKPSLTENINNAMKTGLTAGDVLHQFGVSRGVQVPLGFALDVMFDPINWATAGTAALIPRVGSGLVRGTMKGGIKSGLEAAGTGLVSNLEKKAATTMNLMPNRITEKILTKAPFGESYRNIIGSGASKFTNLAEKMGEKAIIGAEKYDLLTGKDVYSKLNKGIFGQPSGIVGETVENFVRKVPSVNILGKETLSGDVIADFFKYSTKKSADIADLRDKVINLAKNKGAILVPGIKEAHFETIDDFLRTGATIPEKIGETINNTVIRADGVLKPEYVGAIKIYDSFDNAKALLETAGEDYNLKHLIEAYKVTEHGETGVQWYDDVIEKLKTTKIGDIVGGEVPTIEQAVNEAGELIKTWNSYTGVRNLKPFEKMLNANQSLISLFKSAKVPMNVASHVVSNIGNFFMGAMMGLPTWKYEYLVSLKKANFLVKGRLSAAGFKDMFFGDINSLIHLADNNPTRFKQLTGINASEIANKLSIQEKITNTLSPKSTLVEAKKILEEGLSKIEEGIMKGEKLASLEGVASKAVKSEAESGMNAKIFKEGIKRFETPSEITARMIKQNPIKRSEEFGSFTTSEISTNDKLDKLKMWIATESANNPNNVAYRLANTLVNSMPRWYEHIDQTFKIGTADFATKVGFTEPQLRIISRTVPMTEADILPPIIKKGEKLYRVTPLKASEIATEAYMNYAAMPDFVRVMRALPIVGSPFLSFPYAMAVKTGKTLINNPAIFNKVGFMINEMNVARTPQEKKAMEEKYNQYLKSPTVVKMFGMWNTNVKNLIPYYQMNMFNPSERAYTGNSFQAQIMKLSDKFPIMQDPIGSVIKDYFIQPWLLSGTGEVAQGQFGQPILPSYDEKGNIIKPSLGTKAFYGGRALAESVVPGALGFTGLLNFPANLSPETIEMIPSYGFRNISNATQGRSSSGISTKENAMQKTLRAVLGRSGLPAYTLDATKTSTSK